MCVQAYGANSSGSSSGASAASQTAVVCTDVPTSMFENSFLSGLHCLEPLPAANSGPTSKPSFRRWRLCRCSGLLHRQQQQQQPLLMPLLVVVLRAATVAGPSLNQRWHVANRLEHCRPGPLASRHQLSSPSSSRSSRSTQCRRQLQRQQQLPHHHGCSSSNKGLSVCRCLWCACLLQVQEQEQRGCLLAARAAQAAAASEMA